MCAIGPFSFFVNLGVFFRACLLFIRIILNGRRRSRRRETIHNGGVCKTREFLVDQYGGLLLACGDIEHGHSRTNIDLN